MTPEALELETRVVQDLVAQLFLELARADPTGKAVARRRLAAVELMTAELAAVRGGLWGAAHMRLPYERGLPTAGVFKAEFSRDLKAS